MNSSTPRILQKTITEAVNNGTSHRSKGYVSERMNEKASWSLEDLEVIAPIVGCVDGFDLMLKAREWYASKENV